MATREQLRKILDQANKRNASSGTFGFFNGGSTSKADATSRDVTKLKSTVQRERNKEQYLKTGKLSEKPAEHQSNPTVISRIFDVLSRGNYAVAEGARRGRVAENKAIGKGSGSFGDTGTQLAEFGKGIVTGLEGKTKTTFSDYLKEVANSPKKDAVSKAAKNKIVQGVGGLALDVLADPLNAVGGFVTKGEKAVDIAAKAGKVFQVTRDAKTTIDAAKTAKRVATLDALKSGVERKTANKIGRSAEHSTKQGIAMEASQQAKDVILAKKGSLGIKVLGVPVIKSEKAYSGLAAAGKKLSKTGAGNKFLEAFSLAHHFPGDTLMIKRMHENAGVATWEEEAKQIRGIFKGLTKKEKISISHAIEDGTDLTGITSKSGLDLGELKTRAQGINDTLFHDAVHNLDVLEPEKYNPNYVYHYYKGGNKTEQDAFRAARKTFAVGTEKPGFAEKRVIKTLQEAKEAGLKPVEAIDDILLLRTAKHQQVVARKDFVDSIVDKYGVKLQAGEARKLGFSRPVSEQKFLPKEMYLPKDVTNTLERLNQIRVNDEVGNTLLKHFDKVQGIWKFGATAVNPGHHVRNMVGDIWNNFEDGVTSAKPYYDAIKVLDRKGSYKIGDLTVDGNRLLGEFIHAGGRSGFYRTEFGKAGLTKPVETIRNMAEERENFTRMAHFLHAVREEGKGVKNADDLRRIAQKVVHERVNKFNFDYGAVTPFEKNVMKRVIPFYTWSRKNIPLQLEMLALKPGRIATLPKGSKALEKLLGVEGESSDIGGGEVIPKWIHEMSPIKIHGEEHGGNSVFFAPPVPFMDIGDWTEGSKQEKLAWLLSQTSPVGRVPIELAEGKQLYSGAPIKDVKQYFAGQVPSARTLSKAKGGDLSKWQLLNYLTGASMYENTPKMQKSELRRQQDIESAKLHKLIDAKKKQAQKKRAKKK